MKRLMYISCLVLLAGSILNSCQKMAEQAIECLRVSELTEIKAEPDGNRKMKFWAVSYAAGSMQSIKWDFGDGSSASSSHSAIVIHTFPSTGNYTVKASVDFKLPDGSSCGPIPQKDITVQ